MNTMRIFRTIFLTAGLWAALAVTVCAAPAEKTLRAGESDVCEFDGLTTAASGDSAIAGLVPLSKRRLLINAKAPGRTTVLVYDKHGKHLLHLTVLPLAPDLAPVAAQIGQDIGLPTVTVRPVGDTILLEGAVSSSAAAQRAETIAGVYAAKVKNLLTVFPAQGAQPTSQAETYAALLKDSLGGSGIRVRVVDERTLALTGNYATPPPPRTVSATAPGPSAVAAADPLDRLLASLPTGLRVINLVNFGAQTAQQILVRAKVIDINRSAAKSLGISWGSLNTSDQRSGQTSVFVPQPLLFGQDPSSVFSGSPLGGGGLKRILPLAAQINALVSENKARILSEPSLVVLDGAEGNILVGGEIPIPVAQNNTGTGGASVTVEYKSYGVKLDVRAAIVSEGTVQMTVTPEVSQLDYSNSVQLNGFVIPSLIVRRATSTLQMQDGQTLVIGGLYSSEATRQVQRIPLLSQIPVLGEFFKNTQTRKSENELLILIEPEIVTAATPGVRPPDAGSPENLPIQRPDVPRRAFDQDFPDLTPSREPRRGAPKTPARLPEPPVSAGGVAP